MARIGIDATAIGAMHKGAARDQKNIIWSLSLLTGAHEYFVFHRTSDAIPISSEQDRWHFIRVSFPLAFIWEQIQIPLLIRKYRLDVFHKTSDRMPIFASAPVIMSLAEIPIYRLELNKKLGLHDQWYQGLSEFWTRFVFPYSLWKAKVIIAFSEFTKRDLIDKFQVPAEKIKAAYLAHDPIFKPASSELVCADIRRRVTGGHRYLLHFSTGDARENTTTALEAFQLAKREIDESVKLVIAGVKPKREYLDRLLEKTRTIKDSIVCLNFVPDEQLVELYQGADAYLDPSLYEGFGYQPLEAMACGAPVIASQVTAIPEVVGDAGILISPADVSGFARAIITVMTNAQVRDELRRKGLMQATHYSWRQMAQTILESIDEILGERESASACAEQFHGQS